MTASHVFTALRDAAEDSSEKLLSPATPAATGGGRKMLVTTPVGQPTATGSGAIGAAVSRAGGPASATILRPPVEEALVREPARRPVVVVVLAQKVICWP